VDNILPAIDTGVHSELEAFVGWVGNIDTFLGGYRLADG
jgi:hypothetical protein